MAKAEREQAAAPHNVPPGTPGGVPSKHVAAVPPKPIFGVQRHHNDGRAKWAVDDGDSE